MINRSLNLFIFIFVIFVVGIETYTYWFQQLRPWQPISAVGRLIFYYSFFTVLSNIMFGISCLMLFLKPSCSNTVFNVIRLNGLVGIIITMIVYNVMLRGIHRPPTLLLAFANESLHLVLPILGLITWFIYGPFGRIKPRIIFYAFLSLLTYGIYIFTRGYYTGQYPYPFINVNRVGYEKALYATEGVAILFFLVVLLLILVERIRIKIAHKF
ncbi:Pr6Pr family membrane protein [Orbus sturtevantii]|uniref:Pr6Pr family membrane protein n=1 Tax=Orbus sturtevantii TaxID=3074109 RepID=UPI00370D5E76